MNMTYCLLAVKKRFPNHQTLKWLTARVVVGISKQISEDVYKRQTPVWEEGNITSSTLQLGEIEQLIL